VTSLSGFRLQDVLPLGALVRALLTFVAVADAVLAVQFWFRHVHVHHHQRTAGDLALVGLASMKVLGALVLAGAAVYLATRPKRAFRRILVLITVFAALAGLAASQRVLVAVAVTDCLAALLAFSLWPEVGNRRSSQLGWALLGGSVAATAWLFLLEKPDQRMGFLFVLVLGLALVAAISSIALLDRNPSLPSTRSLPRALARLRLQCRERAGAGSRNRCPRLSRRPGSRIPFGGPAPRMAAGLLPGSRGDGGPHGPLGSTCDRQ
jgi:hypothetical protein